MADVIEELRAMVIQLPEGLRADWRNTNHYEMHQPPVGGASWWWLSIPDLFDGRVNLPATPEGQRLGLLLDIAVKLKEAWPVLEEALKERANG